MAPAPTCSSSGFIELKDSDIVCGRGGLANKHPGNRLLRRICNENRALYQSSMNPNYKQCLILSILTAIQQNGGRFLTRCTKSGGGWNEISDKKAKEKTAQLLRECEDPSATTTNNKPIAKAAQPTKPAIKDKNNLSFDVSNDDCLLQTPATTKQPKIVSPETVKDMYTPHSIPSDDLSNLLQQPLLEPFPDNVPLAESLLSSSSPPMIFLDGNNNNVDDDDDDDLFDSIVEAIETEITSHGLLLDAYPNDNMVHAVC